MRKLEFLSQGDKQQYTRFMKQLFNNSNCALSPLLLKEGIMDIMALMLLNKQKLKMLWNVLGYEFLIHSRSHQSEVGRNSYILLFLPEPHAYAPSMGRA